MRKTSRTAIVLGALALSGAAIAAACSFPSENLTLASSGTTGSTTAGSGGSTSSASTGKGTGGAASGGASSSPTTATGTSSTGTTMAASSTGTTMAASTTSATTGSGGCPAGCDYDGDGFCAWDCDGGPRDDCNDHDRRVFPDAGYQTSPMLDPGAAEPGTGLYDFNCDGITEQEIPVLLGCGDGSDCGRTCGGALGTPAGPGFESNVACGAQGEVGVCAILNNVLPCGNGAAWTACGNPPATEQQACK
jgi:hypothetical protein